MKFSKDTKIIVLGHLKGHTEGKEDILKANGYTNVSSILCEETEIDQIKVELKEAARAPSPYGTMFLIGIAMMAGFPAMMADILEYIEKECPNILVVKTTKADFDQGISWPPSKDAVNKSALNVCTRLLYDGKVW
jgi:hypothetical protein